MTLAKHTTKEITAELERRDQVARQRQTALARELETVTDELRQLASILKKPAQKNNSGRRSRPKSARARSKINIATAIAKGTRKGSKYSPAMLTGLARKGGWTGAKKSNAVSVWLTQGAGKAHFQKVGRGQYQKK